MISTTENSSSCSCGATFKERSVRLYQGVSSDVHNVVLSERFFGPFKNVGDLKGFLVDHYIDTRPPKSLLILMQNKEDPDTRESEEVVVENEEDDIVFSQSDKDIFYYRYAIKTVFFEDDINLEDLNRKGVDVCREWLFFEMHLQHSRVKELWGGEKRLLSEAAGEGLESLCLAILQTPQILSSIDVNEKNRDNKTCLMFAAAYGHTELVKLLVEKDLHGLLGLLVNEQEMTSGETALMIASRWGNGEIVKMLLEVKGISITKENKAHNCAWSIAQARGYSEIADMIRETCRNTQQTGRNTQPF